MLVSFPFVLLYHELPDAEDGLSGDATRGSHWDLMIATDKDGKLRTWALDELPDFSREDDFSISALALPAHRRIYLEYEGAVSGDRGTVRRVADGQAVWNEGGETVQLSMAGNNWLASFHDCTDDSKATVRIDLVRER